jgi:TetR/AcrR family transcriptional regulator, tetracycline repressor protein
LTERAEHRIPSEISPFEIYDAAVHIVDTEGLRALTMRRLAEATGIAPMSLYRFASSKERLVARLSEHVLRGLTSEASPGASWRELLTHEVVSFRTAVRRHPGLIDLLSIGEDAVPALDGLRERVLCILRDAGIEDRTAVESVGGLFALTLGFGIATQARGIGFQADVYDRLHDLPIDEFPNLRAMASQYAEHWSDRAFHFGVQAILDAVEATSRR